MLVGQTASNGKGGLTLRVLNTTGMPQYPYVIVVVFVAGWNRRFVYFAAIDTKKFILFKLQAFSGAQLLEIDY